MMWLAWGAMVVVAHATAVEHVRVLVGDGTTLSDATVVWDEHGITGVGHPNVPVGARRVDGTNKVLAPGFIETRTHLGLCEVDEEETTHDFALNDGLATPAFQASDGFNPASIRIPVVRDEGITSVIIQPDGRILHGTGAWVDLTGQLPAPPLAAVAMYGNVSRAAATAVGARGGVWLALRDIFADVRFYQRNRSAIDRGEARRLILRPTHLNALIPVLEGKLPLVLYADRASDILKAIELAQSERLKLIISGGAEAWRVAPALAAAKIPVILKPTSAEPSSFDTLISRTDAARILHTAGVPLILSAGDLNQEIPRLRQQAGIAVAFGLPYDAAIAAIANTPAKVFGKDKELGSIAVGRRANLVLWSDDPLETTSIAEQIWIDGAAQTGLSRQRLLVERYLHPTPPTN